jgi:hypothetical protein
MGFLTLVVEYTSLVGMYMRIPIAKTKAVPLLLTANSLTTPETGVQLPPTIAIVKKTLTDSHFD